MALDAASFLVRFPEFTNVDTAQINARIADAAHYVDATTWGDELDAAQALMAAHLLQTSPAGQMARLQTDKAESTYKAAFDAAVWRVTAGDRVF